MASKRLIGLKRRFIQDQDLFVRNSNVIRKSFCKYRAEIVPIKNLRNDHEPKCYLPHYAVSNPKMPTKLRAIFDCAVRLQGHSLNDHLLQGPDMTTS